MYILVVFLLLGLLEFLFLRNKSKDIRDYISLINDVSTISGIKSERYGAIVRIFGRILRFGYKILWILVPVIVLLNFIISLIIGGILNLIF